MLFTFWEILDIAAMTLILGIMFSDTLAKFKPQKADIYSLSDIPIQRGFFINWDNVKFAAMMIAPAIILHELGHKFMALYFGYSATFHAAYIWLLFGLVLKFANAPFIFFVPAYVSIQSGNGTPISLMLISFAGPLINLVLWLGSYYWLEHRKVRRKYMPMLLLTSKINMFLFIFNMIPLPGFDGQKVFLELFRMLF